MKNYFITTAFLLLLFCKGHLAVAQSLSYRELTQEIQILQKQMVPDKRVAIFEIEFNDTLQPVPIVSGETNLPGAKTRIVQLLKSKGCFFTDSIRVLPDTSLGTKTWALANLSVSNLRAQPDHASELVSQVLMGTPLKVLDFNKGWYRVQTPELYLGWMDAAGLIRLTGEELDKWKDSDRYVFNTMTGHVLDVAGKKGKPVTDLVLGDLFELENEKNGFIEIKMPDGRTGFVKKADCLSLKTWLNREPDVKSLISVARQMMGSPYLWGGTSAKAVDCSGFTKLVYFSQGIILARDASQQARYGEAIDMANRNQLQPGDLLFFGRSAQRISHVGLYIGNGDFIHSSGRVHISSIDPSDPKFVPTRNHVATRRIVNSLNSEGIVRVADHPWYVPDKN